jgi:hypothetical protein
MLYYNHSISQGSRGEDGGETTRLESGTEPEPEPILPERAEWTRDHAGGGAAG